MKQVNEIPPTVRGGASTKYRAIHDKVWDGNIWELEESDLPDTPKNAYSALRGYAKSRKFKATVRIVGGKIYVQKL